MKVTLKVFVHKNNCGDGFVAHAVDMSSYGYLLVGTAEFEYTVPADFNPVAAEVSVLRKQLDKLSDKYHRDAAQIKGRINDLLCLEAPDENAEAADFLGARA